MTSVAGSHLVLSRWRDQSWPDDVTRGDPARFISHPFLHLCLAALRFLFPFHFAKYVAAFRFCAFFSSVCFNEECERGC